MKALGIGAVALASWIGLGILIGRGVGRVEREWPAVERHLERMSEVKVRLVDEPALYRVNGNVVIPTGGVVLGRVIPAPPWAARTKAMKARVRKLKHVNRLLWRAVDSMGVAVTECERDLGRRKHQ